MCCLVLVFVQLYLRKAISSVQVDKKVKIRNNKKEQEEIPIGDYSHYFQMGWTRVEERWNTSRMGGKRLGTMWSPQMIWHDGAFDSKG